MPAGVQATPTCIYIMCPVATASVTNAGSIYQEVYPHIVSIYIDTCTER